LSRQVKDFQEHYKIRFYRKSKSGRILLTPAGEALRVIARDLLDARDEAMAALEAIHLGEADTLRIGCAPFVDREICRRTSELQKALVPASSVKFTNADTVSLLDELHHDRLDAAILSLPITDPDLRIEIIKRERLVVCLPSDHPLAKKTALSAADLTRNLTVFQRPAQHPEAHRRLRELLTELGVEFEEQALSSHPQDMLDVVKGGDGFALLREGTPLMEGLTTRPILGVDWTVDTAVVYKRNPNSKLIPIIAKNLKRRFFSASRSRNAEEKARNPETE